MTLPEETLVLTGSVQEDTYIWNKKKRLKKTYCAANHIHKKRFS